MAVGIESGGWVIAPCVWLQSGLVSFVVNEVLYGGSVYDTVSGYERAGVVEQQHGLVSCVVLKI